MDRGTAIGLALAMISILGAAVVEAGSITILFALMNLPSAMIVFGGTIGALIVAFPLGRVTKLGKVLGVGDCEIERQNRELLKTLSEMNAKLDALSHPEVASNAASPAAAAGIRRNTFEVPAGCARIASPPWRASRPARST